MAGRTAAGPDSPGHGPDYGIAAIARMFDVVAAIMHAGPSTLAEIAEQAGCNRATAFRVLHTLQARGLVTQDRPRGPWRLGATWLSVAQAARRQRALELAAAPAMSALAAASHEGVYLAVRDGQEAETLAVHPGDKQIRLYAKRGDRAPLHAGPGRLLLAYAPPSIQRAALATRLARLGPATRTDAASIAADLQRVGARGWLITHDEIEEGVVTVSMPVRDSAGEVLAVLSIISPTLRMKAPRPHTLLTGLMQAAGAVGSAIGVLL
jgi:IclR family acetate operon transcriptional repressor